MRMSKWGSGSFTSLSFNKIDHSWNNMLECKYKPYNLLRSLLLLPLAVSSSGQLWSWCEASIISIDTTPGNLKKPIANAVTKAYGSLPNPLPVGPAVALEELKHRLWAGRESLPDWPSPRLGELGLKWSGVRRHQRSNCSDYAGDAWGRSPVVMALMHWTGSLCPVEEKVAGPPFIRPICAIALPEPYSGTIVDILSAGTADLSVAEAAAAGRTSASGVQRLWDGRCWYPPLCWVINVIETQQDQLSWRGWKEPCPVV